MLEDDDVELSMIVSMLREVGDQHYPRIEAVQVVEDLIADGRAVLLYPDENGQPTQLLTEAPVSPHFWLELWPLGYQITAHDSIWLVASSELEEVRSSLTVKEGRSSRPPA